jgi:hypothetical protein
MAHPPVDDEGIEQFEDGLHGDLIGPEDPDYDDARAVWNGMIDKRPALIARCRGAADVATAVEFARENDLLVAVRGGGHNVAGTAVCDDGIVIDLSRMNGVTVDPGSRTAVVGAAPVGPTSTAPSRSTGWRRPAARSRSPGSPDSPSAAAWASFTARSASPATTCVRWRSSPLTG